MLSTHRRRSGRVRAAIAGATAAAVAMLGGLTLAPTASADEVALPDVIPSIDGWEPSTGSFAVPENARIVVDHANDGLVTSAEILRDELETVYPGIALADGTADAGDIELIVEPGREDLGEEGYELEVADIITVTAGTGAGAFYGTRTVSQMLTQQSTVPQGAVTDIPAYTERGVTLCACVINISPDFIDRLIEQMAHLKLNTLMVELKVKVDAYPQTNTWSYYTKEDIAALVAKATRYGIDVVPEINSPGHMEIWLENMPELQLTNEETGEKDEVRMDITKDASFDFYTELIDEYSEVFTSEYWHMGVDEYMLGSGYDNFPQILEFAHDQWGSEATEDDVVAWYVNKVNAYVEEQGMSLRIWNDGVQGDNQVVDFDQDILIEHWNQAGSTVLPQDFVDAGHDIVNVSNSLYMVRGGYGVDVQNLYNNDWTPAEFYGSVVTDGVDHIRGARISAWPDAGTPQEAENVTEQRMFEPLNLLAQATWSASTPWATYDEFSSAMDEIGRPPLWHNVARQPIAAGGYTFSAADGSGSLAAGEGAQVALGAEGLQFAVEPTADDYYVITSPDGRCLDISRNGTTRLQVPVEIGTGIELTECDGTTIQKWQIRTTEGGYHIINAASQQHLSISDGLAEVPVSGEGFHDVPDGRVVQTPADWGQTVWSLTGAATITAELSAPVAVPGDSIAAEVSAVNGSEEVIAGAEVRVVSIPDGWTAVPRTHQLGDLDATDTAAAEVVFHNITGASDGTFVLELVDGTGTVVATAEGRLGTTCSVGAVQPTGIASVSSEQTSGEPEPNGPAAAAIDGDPGTYWHSQWSAPEAQYPHSIVVDLGEPTEACGLWYTGRSSTGSGGANGRIGDYDVYTSTTESAYDSDGWGEPVGTGTFENSAEAQLAPFPAQTARYVKLVARTEVNGNPWATAGELAVAGPPAVAPTYDPALEIAPGEVAPSGELTVTGSGFAPGELVALASQSAADTGSSGTFAVTTNAGVESSVTEYANAEGVLEVTYPVAADAAAGEYALTATGQTSGAAAVGEFEVLSDGSGGSGSDTDTAGSADASSNEGDDGGSAPGDDADTGDNPATDAEDGTANAAASDGLEDGTAAADEEGSASAMPETGATIWGPLAVAVVLLIGGAGLLLVRQRRERSAG